MEKFKCICGKEFESEKRLKYHRLNCHTCKEAREKFYNKYRNYILNMYKDYSLRYISDNLENEYFKFGFSSNPYEFLLRKLKEENIHIKNVKEVKHLKSVQDKRKNSCLKIYGVDNVSKSKLIKDKKIITCNKNYGVNNPQQSNLIKEKTKNTRFEKYGTLNIINKNNGKESKPHTKVLEYLKSLNYEYKSEYTIHCKDENGRVIRTPRVDIYIPKLNLCVEVYGDWCHANPRRFEKEDEIELWECKKI